ncbi:HS12B-like protein [Mya arenaria]|uniref:HS12B-like protein n=1 Tax=Mya arenaria TaxID=6604 RepID=A0ABY7EYY4_MYAAR|nr:HS12B-like protein [Mya arenaria]
MDMKGAVAFQGSQYMVVDLGGGTADISVLERKPDGTLKEIHKASGGSWGGIYVDENYMKMLNELFGEKALTELRKTEMNDYFDVTREFEHKKRSFDTYKTKQIIVRVSASLRDLAEKYSSKSLEERIASLKVRENAITMRGKDKLKIDTTVVQSWFKRPIDLLIQHLKSLLAEPKIQSVRTVILVGGFGESPYVQERIRNELAGMRVIVPADAGLAVLKGAVRFGHNPVIVSSRIMKYTYGVNGFVKFDEQKHPEEKKVLKNGEWLVKDCFKVYVRVKEEVRVDQQVTMQSLPISKTSLTSVYRTTQEYPEYTTDTGCELLGSIELENSTAGVDQKCLKLALEPECATVRCETLSMDFKGAVTVQGSQFMVVDLGDGTMKEIHKASGSPWGGIYTEMNDYFDVIREFEHKKRSFDTEKTNQFFVRISVSLRDLAEKNSSKSLEE